MKNLSKKTILVSAVSSFVLGSVLSYSNAQTRRAKTQAAAAKSSLPVNSSLGENDFQQAIQLVRSGRYQDASAKLFQLSLSPKYADRRTQLRYLLGLTLYQMKMNQLYSFQ